ncbi:MAG: phosphate ABC transporter permease subunit PstC [Bacteroidetes bacterium]|nr:phosphate ABC transporter permease subunit PstC [Bacteroidota bacterium]MBU1717880.1 phosphate ABC transporter permease subunit PstC [Bacteroidota bacterium]
MYAGIALVVILFGFIGVVLFIKASPVFYEQSVSDILFSDDWKPLSGKFGMLAFIISSLYITLIAVAISAPVCLLAAIFLTQYADRRLLTLMQPVIDILAGLPSVIYGVWGIIVIVPFVSDVIAPAFGRETNGYTILSAGLVLAVMIIPFMLNIMIEVLRSVPTDLKEASLSLGATYWQTIKYVVVKKSFPGIASAIGLGVSRAFGETIAVLMVAGNVTRVPENVFQPGYPLPALIANNYGEMMSIPLYDSALMLAALVLFVVVIFFNLIARSSIIRLEKYS